MSGEVVVVEDNFTLAAARARNAREILLRDPRLSAVQNRIVLVAYGDTLPRYQPPSDRRNRRIEIHIIE